MKTLLIIILSIFFSPFSDLACLKQFIACLAKEDAFLECFPVRPADVNAIPFVNNDLKAILLSSINLYLILYLFYYFELFYINI